MSAVLPSGAYPLRGTDPRNVGLVEQLFSPSYRNVDTRSLVRRNHFSRGSANQLHRVRMDPSGDFLKGASASARRILARAAHPVDYRRVSQYRADVLGQPVLPQDAPGTGDPAATAQPTLGDAVDAPPATSDSKPEPNPISNRFTDLAMDAVDLLTGDVSSLAGSVASGLAHLTQSARPDSLVGLAADEPLSMLDMNDLHSDTASVRSVHYPSVGDVSSTRSGSVHYPSVPDDAPYQPLSGSRRSSQAFAQMPTVHGPSSASSGPEQWSIASDGVPTVTISAVSDTGHPQPVVDHTLTDPTPPRRVVGPTGRRRSFARAA